MTTPNRWLEINRPAWSLINKPYYHGIALHSPFRLYANASISYGDDTAATLVAAARDDLLGGSKKRIAAATKYLLNSAPNKEIVSALIADIKKFINTHADYAPMTITNKFQAKAQAGHFPTPWPAWEGCSPREIFDLIAPFGVVDLGDG